MIDITRPEAGYYTMRLKRGAPPVGISLFYGQPLEPWTLETMDRAPTWNALVNGEWIDFERVWPVCAGSPITREQYEEFCIRAYDARTGDNAFDNPLSNPRRETNWLNAPSMF